jgi:V/A-type H+-transporting ATPase subunit A
MKVIGEEGVSLKDYVDYLKGEFFDFVYLQQNAFDPVDEATAAERQQHVFAFIDTILSAALQFGSKEEALQYFQKLRQEFRGWNSAKWESQEFKDVEAALATLVAGKTSKPGEAAHA